MGLNAVARRSILTAIVLLAFALTGASVIRKPAVKEAEIPNGTAVAYVKGPLTGSFSLAATLTLDRVPANRSWYCDWLMVVGQRKHTAGQPFVQVGLMRWAQNGYRLSAFIAKSNARGGIDYFDAEHLRDGPHAVSMRARKDWIDFDVDGRRIGTYPMSLMFAKNDVLYGQLAGEAVKSGDRVSGTIDAIAIATHGERPHPYTGKCRYDDRGLRVDTTPAGLAVRGTLDPAHKSGFNAACNGFFDEHVRRGDAR
jgi:hypothetical protein